MNNTTTLFDSFANAQWTDENVVGSMLIILVVFFVLSMIVSGIISLFGEKTSEDIDTPQKKPEIPEIDLVQGGIAIDYLERLIKEKYNYYMYLELLPIYLDKKIPEKNIISQVKEKIYVSVVGSLTRPVKTEILKYFTEKGIEIYVNEQIIIMMNETDFRSAGKFSETFKEITANNVDKII